MFDTVMAHIKYISKLATRLKVMQFATTTKTVLICSTQYTYIHRYHMYILAKPWIHAMNARLHKQTTIPFTFNGSEMLSSPSISLTPLVAIR